MPRPSRKPQRRDRGPNQLASERSPNSAPGSPLRVRPLPVRDNPRRYGHSMRDVQASRCLDPSWLLPLVPPAVGALLSPIWRKRSRAHYAPGRGLTHFSNVAKVCQHDRYSADRHQGKGKWRNANTGFNGSNGPSPARIVAPRSVRHESTQTPAGQVAGRANGAETRNCFAANLRQSRRLRRGDDHGTRSTSAPVTTTAGGTLANTPPDKDQVNGSQIAVSGTAMT